MSAAWHRARVVLALRTLMAHFVLIAAWGGL